MNEPRGIEREAAEELLSRYLPMFAEFEARRTGAVSWLGRILGGR